MLIFSIIEIIQGFCQRLRGTGRRFSPANEIGTVPAGLRFKYKNRLEFRVHRYQLSVISSKHISAIIRLRLQSCYIPHFTFYKQSAATVTPHNLPRRSLRRRRVLLFTFHNLSQPLNISLHGFIETVQLLGIKECFHRLFIEALFSQLNAELPPVEIVNALIVRGAVTRPDESSRFY